MSNLAGIFTGWLAWGRLFVLLYLGSLLIVTRALNMFLYHAP